MAAGGEGGRGGDVGAADGCPAAPAAAAAAAAAPAIPPTAAAPSAPAATGLTLQPRPAELPTKPSHELSAHLREARAVEAKIARERAAASEHAARRERRLTRAAVEWRTRWLPKWQAQSAAAAAACTAAPWNPRRSRSLRALWSVGLPPSVRGEVWRLAVGNALNITPELFRIFKEKARPIIERQQMQQMQHANGAAAVESSSSSSSSGAAAAAAGERPSPAVAPEPSSAAADREHQPAVDDSPPVLGMEHTVHAIPLDLPRTFPALSFFAVGGPLMTQLQNVLQAYVCYRPDIGYIQGMSYIAAVISMYEEEYDAFVLLANLFNQPLFRTFFHMENLAGIELYMGALERIVATQLPRVSENLRQHRITPHLFLVDWVMTLYTKPLPLDLACHLWDLVILEGDWFAIKIAAGILKHYSGVLEKGSFEQCLDLLTHLQRHGIDERLIESVDKIQLTEEKFGKLLAQVRAERSATPPAAGASAAAASPQAARRRGKISFAGLRSAVERQL